MQKGGATVPTQANRRCVDRGSRGLCQGRKLVRQRYLYMGTPISDHTIEWLRCKATWPRGGAYGRAGLPSSRFAPVHQETERRVAIGILKEDAPRRQPIHVRCAHQRVTVAAAEHRCVFVGHEEEESRGNLRYTVQPRVRRT